MNLKTITYEQTLMSTAKIWKGSIFCRRCFAFSSFCWLSANVDDEENCENTNKIGPFMWLTVFRKFEKMDKGGRNNVDAVPSLTFPGLVQRHSVSKLVRRH